MQRIMSRDALEQGRITHASQDGNREFISLLACICADGTALPPALIYKGNGGLQDTWLEDFGIKNETHFASSVNGWLCDNLGLFWLEHIFHRYTSKKAGNRCRLLIVDGHSSHVNMKFINLADELRIIILILPPHSTHRLQPLDVSLFAPLATFYTNGLNTLMFNSLGIVSMSKKTFWNVFLLAWKQAFSEKNIASGFKKTGIWPCNPALVIVKITKPHQIEAVGTLQGLETPMTCGAVRRIQRQYIKAPDLTLLSLVFRANERLASQHSVDQHVRRGLTEALRHEKKRRQRGKRLNLLGEEDSSPQFFSPGRVQAARDYQATKDTDETLRQKEILDKKALAAAKKIQKEAEKVERAACTTQKRQLVIEAKIQKAAEKQVQIVRRQSIVPQKVPTIHREQIKVPVAQAKVDILVTSRGRRVQRPQRFAT
jgi:hypothetical protein